MSAFRHVSNDVVTTRALPELAEITFMDNNRLWDMIAAGEAITVLDFRVTAVERAKGRIPPIHQQFYLSLGYHRLKSIMGWRTLGGPRLLLPDPTNAGTLR